MAAFRRRPITTGFKRCPTTAVHRARSAGAGQVPPGTARAHDLLLPDCPETGVVNEVTGRRGLGLITVWTAWSCSVPLWPITRPGATPSAGRTGTRGPSVPACG